MHILYNVWCNISCLNNRDVGAYKLYMHAKFDDCLSQ